MQFEGVDLSANNLTKKVIEQLATGLHRGHDDSSPSDWLVRAWETIPSPKRAQLAEAVNEALTHSSPQVRTEALRTLDMAPKMADPNVLLGIAENQFELFRGLRRPNDAPQVDRGRDFVQLTASVATGASGSQFRHKMATDPDYGLHVLASLARLEPDWTVAHVADLVAPELDSDGTRLNILIFNFRQDLARLQQLVGNLATVPSLHGRLRDSIQSKIKDSQSQAILLAEIDK
jgi:hypothetical protein